MLLVPVVFLLLSSKSCHGRVEPSYPMQHRLSPHAPAWSRQLMEILPQVKVRVDPTTSLKIRKNFRWMRTVLSIGADYSTQVGTWSMKYSWEDSLIGGKLLLKGSELQLHKSWIFGLGGDLAANLRFRAALDVATGRVSARFGFRTEQNVAASKNIIDGIDLVKRLPLDGSDGHAKLEVKVRVAFPQPELQLDGGKKSDRDDDDLSSKKTRKRRYAGGSSSSRRDWDSSSSSSSRKRDRDTVHVGMGDLEVDLEELNLLLDW